MLYTVIDQKTESHSYGWGAQKISTTLTLIELSAGKFGLNYNAVYSGIVNGSVSGGPIPVTGNGSVVVNPDPKVTVTISNYSDSGTYISMHVTIIVDIPVIGNETIFDQTLGGQYGVDTLKEFVEHIASLKKAN